MTQGDDLREALKLWNSGRADEAERTCRRLVEAGTGDAWSYNLLGIIEQSRGSAPQAVALLSRAVELAPEEATFRVNLGTALKADGEIERAIAEYERALELNPSLAAAHNNLGNALRGAGRAAEAAAALERAVELDPGYTDAYKNLGLAYRDADRIEDAVAAFERAIALRPDFAEAHELLADLLEVQGHLDAARDHYRRSLKADPARRGPAVKLAIRLPIIHRSRQAMIAARAAFERRLAALLERPPTLADPLVEVGKTNFSLAYHGLNDRNVQAALATLYLRATPSLGAVAAHCRDYRPPADRPVRLGIVSPFMYEHTIGRLMRGMIAELARARFEVTVFTTPRSTDPLREFIARRADRFVVVPPELGAARERIGAAAMDILLHAGVVLHPWSYFLAFARLAPLQCATWGHPVTTGIPNMDYFITSRHLEPQEGAAGHYTERLALLDHLSVYYYAPRRNEARKTRGDFGLEPARTVYLCPQTLFKIHPDFDALAAEILRHDPRGELVLIAGQRREWTRAVLERLDAALPGGNARIRVLPHMPNRDFLDLLEAADVVLDTVHFSGGYSTFEAFAVGTPVVTLPSGFRRGRISYALYREIGCDAGICRTGTEYVQTALRLGQDAELRRAVSGEIRAKIGRLVENPAPVRELETFFEAALRERAREATADRVS